MARFGAIRNAQGRTYFGPIDAVAIQLPVIESVTPASPEDGDTGVTITGQNFGAQQGTVTYGGVPLNVTAWDDTSIVVDWITVDEGTTIGFESDYDLIVSRAIASTAPVEDINHPQTLDAPALTPGGISPEAQAVLARMSALTQTEARAIADFVDGSVALGMWDNVIDCWCFALNGTDWLTAFKGAFSFAEIGSPLHVPGEYVEFPTENDVLRSVENIDTWVTQQDSGALVYVNGFAGADPSSDFSYFGGSTLVPDYEIEFSIDPATNEPLVHWCTTGAAGYVPAPSFPKGDLIGIAHDTTVGEDFLIFGSLFSKAARTWEGIPVAPLQLHGRWYDVGGSDETHAGTRYGFFITLQAATPIDPVLVTGPFRSLVLQLLRDLGVTGVPSG